MVYDIGIGDHLHTCYLFSGLRDVHQTLVLHHPFAGLPDRGMCFQADCRPDLPLSYYARLDHEACRIEIT